MPANEIHQPLEPAAYTHLIEFIDGQRAATSRHYIRRGCGNTH